MQSSTDDLRVDSLRPLIPPAILVEDIPTGDHASATVQKARDAIHDIYHQRDNRLLVVVGPCSIHDAKATLEYGERLTKLARELSDRLFIVLRTYFEKPRTTVGWKGMINDPDLDDSFQINRGLRAARTLLRELNELDLPTGTEFLDPIMPQYLADLVSWGAIGARTSESQTHREMASGLSMPIGFKNATSGAVQVAIDAVRSSQNRHHFLGVTKQGLSAIVATRGNPDCHVILRGGSDKPNYDAASIAEVVAQLEKAKLPPRVMVDCSHGNSSKDHRRQPQVAADVAKQIAEGSRHILGIMLESFLVEGRQDIGDGQSLTYGQSVTDACLGWDQTEQTLRDLATASA